LAAALPEPNAAVERRGGVHGHDHGAARAAYEGMITATDVLGDSEIVALLEANLDDEKAALKKAEKAAETIAKETLSV
jgi:uncharacterized protein DUF892